MKTADTKFGPRFEDITGRRFGSLLVVRISGRKKYGGRTEILWECACDCGVTVVVFGGNVRSGKTKSCGCKRLLDVPRGSSTWQYNVWRNILSRCYQANCPSYPRYGGRGIKVCDRWKNSFKAFLEDIGNPPTGAHSIDRVNNDGDYEPGNVRWATPTEQANNSRRNRKVTYNGESVTIAQLARKTGVRYGLLRDRLVCQNWTVEEAVNLPASFTSRRHRNLAP